MQMKAALADPDLADAWCPPPVAGDQQLAICWGEMVTDMTDMSHYLHRHQHYPHHVICSGQILINSRSNNDRVEGQVLIAIILYDFKETNSILSNAAIRSCHNVVNIKSYNASLNKICKKSLIVETWSISIQKI